MAEKSLLTNHPINTTLNNLKKLFSDPIFRERISSLEPELRVIINAIELFVRQTDERIATSSDREISQNGLRQVASNLQNIWSELNAFGENGNSGHVTSAASNFDGALTAAAWTFFNRPPKGSRAYGESVKAVQKASDDAIERVRNRSAGIASRFTEFNNKLDTLEQTVAGTVGKLNQVSSAADAQLAEIRAEFASIKSQIEQERQADRDTRGEEFDVFFEEQKKFSEVSNEKIAEYESQAKNILQIVGNIGLTGNYQNRASSEQTQANWLRRFAAAFFVVGAGILCLSIFRSFDGTIDPIELIARAIIGITISTPAIYLAKESARHRSNSDNAKQTELELASLTPFLESLPADRKQQVIESLAKSYFGKSVENHTVDHPVELTTDQLVKILIKALGGERA